MQNSKNFPGVIPMEPRFSRGEDLFLFYENVQNSPKAMQNSQIFLGAIPPALVLRKGKGEEVRRKVCFDGAEVSASRLKIGRFLVQVSPKINFSIMIKLPVKSTRE